jgi:hypothetical protein
MGFAYRKGTKDTKGSLTANNEAGLRLPQRHEGHEGKFDGEQ